VKKFKKIYIEITNICNLCCEFCPKTGRTAKFMERDFFENILLKLKGYTEYLYMHVMGEPLLHPELGIFLELCQKHGYKVNITTNGTLIDEAANAIISKPALRQVNFSLHSFEANEQQIALDIYINKIFDFTKTALEKGKLLISFRLWNFSEKGKNDENNYILQRIEEEFGLGGNGECNVLQSKGFKIKENLYLNPAEGFEWPDMGVDDIDSKGFCLGLRDQAAILVDGTVVPCCLDSEGTINLGNIKEQSFDEIINSNRAKELYEGFSRREAVEPLCKKCGYKGRFSG